MVKSLLGRPLSGPPSLPAFVPPGDLLHVGEHSYGVMVIAPPLEEPGGFDKDISPAKLAQALSYFKAESARSLVNEGIIIAGDTLVALEDRIYGKPVDRDHARSIIKTLAGTTHHVITGVTLLDASGDRRLIRHDSTAVTMKPLTDDEVESYLDTDSWKGKAGAYGIQDRGDAFVTKVEGSFTNVVGFPMELVSQMLGEWGFQPKKPEPSKQ